jgi:tetratricopeptide (TPR) repeat protein
MAGPDRELSDEEIRANMKKLSGEIRTSKAKEIEAAQKHLLAAYESKAFAYIQLWENLLWLQMLKGDWPKFEQYLLEAIKSHPGCARFYCTLLWFYFIVYDDKGNDRDAKIKAAIKLIEERNKACPDAELHFLCGKARHEVDDTAGALREFDAAIKLSPGHFGANLGRAVLLMKAGKLREAGEVMENIRENIEVKGREDAVHADLTIAILKMLNKEYDSARELLDEVLREVPENARAGRLRGMLAD